MGVLVWQAQLSRNYILIVKTKVAWLAKNYLSIDEFIIHKKKSIYRFIQNNLAING